MSVKALRDAIDRAEPRRPRPASSGNQRGVVVGGAPSGKDDVAATEAGQWVARRLSELAAKERVAELEATRVRAVRNDAPDLASWTERDVETWLRDVVLLDPSVTAALCEQGVSGLELLTLDDVDLRATGVASLAERKRALRLIRELRDRAASPSTGSSGTGAILGKSMPSQSHRSLLNSVKSNAALRRLTTTRRERMGVLGECLGKVLSLSPAVPLKTKRLLLILWQQTEAIGLEALACVEADAGARLAREEASAERGRRRARTLMERQMRVVGECEDRITELQGLLRLEQQKLSSLRDSMIGDLKSARGSAPARGGKGGKHGGGTDGDERLYARFKPADFAAHEADLGALGESFLHMGGELEELARLAEEVSSAATDATLRDAELTMSEMDGALLKSRGLAELALQAQRQRQLQLQQPETRALASSHSSPSTLPAPHSIDAAEPRKFVAGEPRKTKGKATGWLSGGSPIAVSAPAPALSKAGLTNNKPAASTGTALSAFMDRDE